MTKYNYNDSIDYLEVDPQFITEGIEYAKNKKINSIRIRTLNRNSGQKYDLNFSSFEKIEHITRLNINNDFKIGKTESIESLYSLKKLNHLQIIQPIDLDLSNFNQLESLYIKYDKKLKNINTLTNLKKMLLSSIKEDNCMFIRELKELRELTLSGGIKELKGIDNLSKLISLNISHCSSLLSVKIINNLSNLEKLHIEKCKQLSDYSFLENNSNIKELFIDSLDNISFVSTMPNLEKINFWSCKDKDMEPLVKSNSLKQINFYPNKKHYSHTIEEIIELTGAQRGKHQ